MGAYASRAVQAVQPVLSAPSCAIRQVAGLLWRLAPREFGETPDDGGESVWLLRAEDAVDSYCVAYTPAKRVPPDVRRRIAQFLSFQAECVASAEHSFTADPRGPRR
eukprot:Hpha_TRINITY_DN729_c0_g1::TRINITY_DN729_c0_g1_i1::g.29028::m.29028